jgi:hypothetical protein
VLLHTKSIDGRRLLLPDSEFRTIVDNTARSVKHLSRGQKPCGVYHLHCVSLSGWALAYLFDPGPSDHMFVLALGSAPRSSHWRILTMRRLKVTGQDSPS